MEAKSTCVSKIQTKLINARKKLLTVPSTIPNLLDVLAEVEQVLSEVQRPLSESIERAIRPIVNPLIAKKLMKHHDMDVNISVVCCICEILRIMAPGLPYTNKQMKEFLELVVMTFEKLSSAFGRSYTRMAKFFTICSNFKMPALMSDLQLDGLVVRLFKQFLTVADSNSSAVVAEMEEFLTMLIEESKPLNLELVDLLAASVQKDKQIVSPVCWQLGRNVINNCVAELKPHLPHMFKDTSPHTTEKINLGKVTVHKIKLECLEGTSNTSGIDSDTKSVSYNDPLVPPGFVKQLIGKRKRDLSPKKGNVQSVDYGENLVGSRIKVYWPDDKMYYEGVVIYFDGIRKRHKILYYDGDEETLDLKREQWELVQNVFATSDSEEGSCSESGMTCIQGYTVKSSIAPILKAIFKKHGDIAANCSLQASSMRASLLTVVCDIVRRVQTNDVIEMKEIESEIKDAEAANINVLWIRAHFEAAKKRKEAFMESVLIRKTKENIISVKRAAKMELDETRIELMAAQRKFEKAERCVKILGLVQKKLNDKKVEIEAAQSIL
ncbi:uncharacterized protein [Rutidosis leptorrhynchoides]|uniref:uncharacterized protein n=1 Tax=Rutidosis leptorrhynchoides TaxID=125765 RepID=UPI003A98F762